MQRLWQKVSGLVRPKMRRVSAHQHGIRRQRIQSAAMKVISALHEARFEAFIVGGAVRDLVLGRDPKDFDVVTDARPEEVVKLFRRAHIVGRRFRIVHVMFGKELIEVSTFRGRAARTVKRDEAGRILEDNHYGSIEEDARRRDFTANALYYDPFQEVIVDYHGGLGHLAQKRLVMIGQVRDRFQEDPVRLLRAIRLASKLDLELDEPIKRSLEKMVSLLSQEPAARLFDEVVKVLLCGQAFACLSSLHEEKVFSVLSPLLHRLLSEEGSRKFIELACSKIDQRLEQQRRVSVSFILAALYWPAVWQHWQHFLAQPQARNLPSMLEAISLVSEEQQKEALLLPQKHFAIMREIWISQSRFDVRSGIWPFRLLLHERYRMGFDFYQLRSLAGEVDPDHVQWWEHFQKQDDQGRQAMLEKEPQIIRHHTRSRRSRRRKSGDGSAVQSDNLPTSE